MSRIGTFLFGVIIGGALVFGAQKYHVVRTSQGVELVPKLSASFSETYVDVRKFQADDWAKHKTLAAAIMHAKKEHILQDSAGDQVRQGMGNLMNELTRLRDG